MTLLKHGAFREPLKARELESQKQGVGPHSPDLKLVLLSLGVSGMVYPVYMVLIFLVLLFIQKLFSTIACRSLNLLLSALIYYLPIKDTFIVLITWPALLQEEQALLVSPISLLR